LNWRIKERVLRMMTLAFCWFCLLFIWIVSVIMHPW
jgi:hypothetical protein